MADKKIPLRQCVGCREMKPKKELMRVIRTPEGEVVLDRTGKLNGRGAYLCTSKDCLKQAIKTNALSRALNVKIDSDSSIMQELDEA